jgi:hypothetical protein
MTSGYDGNPKNESFVIPPPVVVPQAHITYNHRLLMWEYSEESEDES